MRLVVLLTFWLYAHIVNAQDWQRYPVFPPGYARVCATETLPNGDVVALDICGRIIDAKTARVISYPYIRSSVDHALRADAGCLIRYLDGSLYTGSSLTGEF